MGKPTPQTQAKRRREQIKREKRQAKAEKKALLKAKKELEEAGVEDGGRDPPWRVSPIRGLMFTLLS